MGRRRVRKNTKGSQNVGQSQDDFKVSHRVPQATASMGTSILPCPGEGSRSHPCLQHGGTKQVQHSLWGT